MPFGRAIRAARWDGLSEEQLAAHLQQQDTCAAGQDTAALLAVLQKHGLIRRVPGFADWAYVASEHVLRYLPDPPNTGGSPLPPLAPDAACSGKVNAQLTRMLASLQPSRDSRSPSPVSEVPGQASASQQAASAGMQAAQPMQEDPAAAVGNGVGSSHAAGQQGPRAVQTDKAGGADAVLMPWQDQKGRLNEPLWRALSQRAVSIVLRHPGAPFTAYATGGLSLFCKTPVPAMRHREVRAVAGACRRFR